jgi:uncharacterized protein YrzB (UPF0473 family)
LTAKNEHAIIIQDFYKEERDHLMSEHEHVHDENCDHEHEEVVILTDDEGNEREFIIVETMQVEGKHYAILVAADGTEDDGFIMRIEEDEEGEEYLIDIEDEQEWQRVVAAYEKMADAE